MACDVVFTVALVVFKLDYCHEVDGRGIKWEYPDAENLGDADIKDEI